MTSRLLALSLAVALVAGSAAPAAACGMYKQEIEPAANRIASAKTYLEKNQLNEAASYARSVAHDRKVDKKTRAEAYSLAGVIRWKQGNKNAAKQNFQKARELDPSQYETVVAAQTDADAIRAVVEEA